MQQYSFIKYMHIWPVYGITKMEKFAPHMHFRKRKCFQLPSDPWSRALPLYPAEGSRQDPRYGLALRAVVVSPPLLWRIWRLCPKLTSVCMLLLHAVSVIIQYSLSNLLAYVMITTGGDHMTNTQCALYRNAVHSGTTVPMGRIFPLVTTVRHGPLSSNSVSHKRPHTLNETNVPDRRSRSDRPHYRIIPLPPPDAMDFAAADNRKS